MRRDWSAEEIGELWTLGPAELVLVEGLPDASRSAWLRSSPSGVFTAASPTTRRICLPLRSGASRPSSASAPTRSRSTTGRAGPVAAPAADPRLSRGGGL